ncbi:MAG TPA: Ig-like domain repeat protein [Terracidiphilus sp.]|nr:Ig-like domain repeat protein [Terracidiphilus sp.]
MRSISKSLTGMVCLSLIGLACLFSPNAQAQASQVETAARGAKQVITLDPPAGWELQVHSFDAQGNARPAAPENFRHLGEATVGEETDLHTLTLRFAQSTRITGISITGDFHVDQGGSCVEGNVYQQGATCQVLVRFAPQGPGNRLGKLSVSNDLSALPAAFGIGGYGYSPVISFIPSIILTVPGTYPSNVGLLNGAQNLAIDGGDTLWVSDTGNNVVRNMDSSGTFKTLASGYTGPLGIAVDTFGEAYFDLNSSANMYEIYDYGPVVQINGAGSLTCTAASPCNLSGEALGSPGMLSMDPYNHMFFPDNHAGAAMVTVQPLPDQLVLMYNPFPYQTNPSSAMTVDSSDNLYSFWTTSGECTIQQASLYNAENSNVQFNKVAGGHTCGFAGDGGLAGNAEISTKIGQMAFDTAGNLYFTDTNNQRVRRIDYVTGTIRTIAGNGTSGYTNDGYPSTQAELANPTGVGIDSQGQVYIISGAASTGTAQVIRKVNLRGFAYFGSQPKGSPTAANVVLVSNTGNSTMVLTSAQFTGNNPSDFVIDPKTTSCLLTAGAVLQSGASCQIGFIFTPAAPGTRSAYLTLLNNTVTNSNSIYLYGNGTLPAATFTITSPANGASFVSGTSVTFSAKVTSGSGPAPTGTVQFKVDGANYGGPVTIASSVASTTVTGLTTATHTLSATYSGDANYAAGGPISVTITVTASAPPPAVEPTVTLASFVPPESVSLGVACAGSMHFQVLVSNGTSQLPTGDVQLFHGSQQLATGTLANGKVVLTAPTLAPGTYSLTARYNGDVLDLPAVSPALNAVVSRQQACSPVFPRLDEPHLPTLHRLAY